MTTITANISDQLNSSLLHAAKSMQRSKSFIIVKALEAYLEDLEDIEIALERIQDPNKEIYTWDQVKDYIRRACQGDI